MENEELKKAVEDAKEEVKVLLKEVQASKPDKIKLETGLKVVKKNLRTVSIHIGRIIDGDDDDDDEDDTK